MDGREDTQSIRSNSQRYRMIHYFYYTEYNKLADLGFNFQVPRKESNKERNKERNKESNKELNIYMSYLNNPIYFALPKSEILEIYECNITQENRLKYVVDEEARDGLVRFLKNLDKLCIELSSINSNQWFKKTVPLEVLEESYYSVYCQDKDENNENVMEIVIEKNELIDRLVDYNRSDSLNLMVCIKGIEFFKSRFKWYITLEKLVRVPSINAQPKKSNLMDLDESSESSESDDESEHDSTDDELQPIQNTHKNVELDDPVRRMNRSDLERYIREKTEESKKLFLNSERVRKTADIIYKKAIQLQNEVNRCKELLRSRNE
jgi:hypothetical protein